MRIFFAISAGLFFAGLTGSAFGDVPQRTGLSMYIERMVATALPYEAARRWEAYLTISRLAEVLWHEDRFGAEIATAQTETFPGFPRLVLYDQDGDRRADFFVYFDEAQMEDTLEFGAFFAEGGAQRPAWIVFNSGPGFEVSEDGEMVFYWATHQFIDRNGDGRFDIYILNGVDSDGDGDFKRDDTEWVFDDNFDGMIDRGESIISGKARVLEPTDGVIPFSQALSYESEAVMVGRPFPALGDMIGADITSALGEAE